MRIAWARIAGAETIRFLVLLVLVSFLVRFGAVVALRGFGAGPSERHGSDNVEYSLLAENLANGTGYALTPGKPTSFRAPGLPFFLSGLYAVAGRDYRVAQIALCLLGAASCLLTYLLARELLSEECARAAALLSVLYLPHIYFATRFDTENLFVPSLALGMWLFIRHLKAVPLGRPWMLAGAGLALGAATLTRPFSLLLPPILMAILARRWIRSGGPILRDLLIFLASFVAVVMPWVIRNHAVHGRFVLIATNGGSTFYGGNNGRVSSELYYLGAWLSTTELPGRDLIEATKDEVAHDKMEWSLGLRWIREHVTTIPQLMTFKFLRLWMPEVETPRKSFIVVQILTYTPFLVLMIAGGVRCLSDRRYWSGPWLVVHGVILATVLTSLIFWGSPRFRDANMPFLMIYSVLGLPGLGRRCTPMEEPRANDQEALSPVAG